MPISEDFSRIVCGSPHGDVEFGSTMSFIENSVKEFSDRLFGFVQDESSSDIKLIGPFCARVVMEIACAAFVARLDPFRALYLRRLHSRGDYDPAKRNKSSFSWLGDVVPNERSSEKWGDNVEFEKISRALLSNYCSDVYWKSAVVRMLDECVNHSSHPKISLLTSIEADSFIIQHRGKALQLYSHLSKGVHWEFFGGDPSTLDAITIREKITEVIVWSSTLGMVSHFIQTSHCLLSGNEAMVKYLSIMEHIDA